MAVTPETITLKPLETVTGFRRYQVGVDLSNAVISNGPSELCGDAKLLRYPFLGIFRLGRMAHRAAKEGSSIDVIAIEEPWPYKTIQPQAIVNDGAPRLRASGIARVRQYNGFAPLATEGGPLFTAKFDYWLRQADGETPEEQGRIGATVLNTLVQRQEPGTLLWSAASASETPKVVALEMTGFERFEHPEAYPLADRQGVTQQLWHKRI